jgi:hypothetical protein
VARGHKSPIQTRCLLRAVRTQVLPRGHLAALHRAEEEALPEGSDPLWKSSSSSSSKPSGINVLQRHSACFVGAVGLFRAPSHYPRRNGFDSFSRARMIAKLFSGKSSRENNIFTYSSTVWLECFSALVYRLAYNGDVAAGQLAVFQGASEAPMSELIRVERATRKNSQLAAAQRVALEMGRRLRCSSVTYRFRYAPSSRLAGGPF